MSLEFSLFHLLVDEDCPSPSDLQGIFASTDCKYKYNDTFHMVKAGIENDRVHWLSTKYGNAKPYTDDVFNTEKETLENNPRKPTQAEPRHQAFFLYDSDSNRFYCSNIKKSSFFCQYAASKINKNCHTRNIYGSVEEFSKHVSKIDSFSFTQERNLMTIDKDIFEQPDDWLGLGKPIDARLTARFGGASTKNRNFFKYLKEWVRKKESGDITDLVCIGRDDNGIESIFNIDNIQRKVAVDVAQNEFGMYNYLDVILKTIETISK